MFVTVGNGFRLHPTVDERTATEAPPFGRQAKAATLDIESSSIDLPHNVAGKRSGRDLGQGDFLSWTERTESTSVGNRGEVTTRARLACGARPGTTGHNANGHRPGGWGGHYQTGLLPLASSKSTGTFCSKVRYPRLVLQRKIPERKRLRAFDWSSGLKAWSFSSHASTRFLAVRD